MTTAVTCDTAAQLLADWAWGNDTNDVGLLGRILADDATFSVAIAGEVVVGPLEGRNAIVGFVGEALATQAGQRRHAVSTVREDGDGFTAYLTIHETVDGETRLVTTGVYRASVGKTLRLDRLAIELDRPF